MSHDKRTQGGLSPKTLLIAGAASAVAAIVIPMLWRPGTVFAAAMTPIIVAVVSEMLRRPVETVSSVRVRRTDRGTAIFDPPPPDRTSRSTRWRRPPRTSCRRSRRAPDAGAPCTGAAR